MHVAITADEIPITQRVGSGRVVVIKPYPPPKKKKTKKTRPFFGWTLTPKP